MYNSVPNYHHKLIEQIKRIYRKKGYAFFDSGNFDMNLIGVRSTEPKMNKFNDWIILAYRDQYGEYVTHIFRCTTDPGLLALQKKTTPNGTAIIVPGQYRSAFIAGKHKRRRAWVQNSNFIVARDRNMDGLPDMENIEVAEPRCGLNLHDAPVRGKHVINYVGKFSEGCQVLPNIFEYSFLDNMLTLSTKFYSATITYTLLEENDFLTQ